MDRNEGQQNVVRRPNRQILPTRQSHLLLRILPSLRRCPTGHPDRRQLDNLPCQSNAKRVCRSVAGEVVVAEGEVVVGAAKEAVGEEVVVAAAGVAGRPARWATAHLSVPAMIGSSRNPNPTIKQRSRVIACPTTSTLCNSLWLPPDDSCLYLSSVPRVFLERENESRG